MAPDNRHNADQVWVYQKGMKVHRLEEEGEEGVWFCLIGFWFFDLVMVL